MESFKDSPEKITFSTGLPDGKALVVLHQKSLGNKKIQLVHTVLSV